MCHFCHGCPSWGGLPVCPCASTLLISNILLLFIRSALTGNKLVSALVPRPSPFTWTCWTSLSLLEEGRLKGKMPYKFQKCIDRGGGKGAGCKQHPGCRAGIPGLTAWAGGWVRRDLRGMSVCMLEHGGPFGGFWGVGGWGGAPRLSTQETIGKGLLSYICKLCFSPPSSLSPFPFPTWVVYIFPLHHPSLSGFWHGIWD
jgi:hypothetical protein